MNGVHVVLRYDGVDYDLVIPDGRVDDQPMPERIHGVEHFWTKGNFSCDCNRSLMIDRYHDDPPDFPNHDGSAYVDGDEWSGMPCGEMIELVSLAVIADDVETRIPLAAGHSETDARLAAMGLKRI